jgi:hypothetical protein
MHTPRFDLLYKSRTPLFFGKRVCFIRCCLFAFCASRERIATSKMCHIYLCETKHAALSFLQHAYFRGEMFCVASKKHAVVRLHPVYVLFWVSKISLGSSNMKWAHAKPEIQGLANHRSVVQRKCPRLVLVCSFLQVLPRCKFSRERERKRERASPRFLLFFFSPRAPCEFFCCAQNASLHMECASMQSIPRRQSRLPKSS